MSKNLRQPLITWSTGPSRVIRQPYPEETAHAFTDRVNDRKVNLQLLMGGKKLLNKALNQTLKLEAANVEARSAVRLPEVWARAPKQRWAPQDCMTHILAVYKHQKSQ